MPRPCSAARLRSILQWVRWRSRQEDLPQDKLILAFWARLEQGENGATSAELPYNAVQLASAPYTQVFGGPATIGPEWHMFEIHGRATQDYAAGALNVAMHLATGHQTIDIGPVFVLNMGQ